MICPVLASINALGGKGYKFKEITVNRYANLLKLQVIKNDQYYWISNSYLYVSNPLIEKIRFVALFEEDVPNELLFGGDCNSAEINEQWCKNPLDKESFIPGYLEQQVLALTSDKLMKTYFSTKQDQSANNLDGQAPNAPAGS